jgi:putative transferase (TIGR04331 family)
MILTPVSIENNFPSSKEVVLLGSWCKNIYTTEVPLENIVPYHWEDKKKLQKDYKYIDNLYETLLPIFAKEMNAYHNCSCSTMFWRISCGNWLLSFVTVAFDRWSMMRSALEIFDIKEIAVLNLQRDFWIPKNMEEFTKLCSKSDEWNSHLFHAISREISDVKITYFQVKVSKNRRVFKKEKIKNFALSLKKKVFNFNKIILSTLSKNNEIVFVDSYLPTPEQWKIEKKLRQFPSSFEFDEPISSTFRNKSRKKIIAIPYESKNNFESFLVSIIPGQIPSSYLEDYNLILSKFRKFPSFSSVKVIFTANAHLTNDQFNIWSAHAKEHGAKLVIGQHGGGTRILKVDQNLDHEYAICDYYIAWGNGGLINKKDTVLPINKFSEYLPKKNSKKKGLLHVLDFSYRYIQHIYSNEATSSYMDYLIDQNIFSKSINNKSHKGYKLRPNKNSFNAGWYDDIKVAESYPIDKEKHFIRSILNNRVVLVSANQTTLLQSLAMNIPTVAFWDSEIVLLEETALKDYKKLYDVGILYDSPRDAANHINEQWDNIEEWWNSSQIQTARKEFCIKYIYTSSNSDRVEKWSTFFNQLIENKSSNDF